MGIRCSSINIAEPLASAFVPDRDKKVCEQVHRREPSQWRELESRLGDERLRELLFRLACGRGEAVHLAEPRRSRSRSACARTDSGNQPAVADQPIDAVADDEAGRVGEGRKNKLPSDPFGKPWLPESLAEPDHFCEDSGSAIQVADMMPSLRSDADGDAPGIGQTQRHCLASTPRAEVGTLQVEGLVEQARVRWDGHL